MRRSHRLPWVSIGLLIVAAAILSPACVSYDQGLANEGFKAIEKANYAVAEAKLKQALEINDRNPYALLNLGAVYQRTGRPEEARVLFQKLIEMDANQKPDRVTKGFERLTLKQLAEKNIGMLPKK